MTDIKRFLLAALIISSSFANFGTADARTYYVRAGGSNSNTGLSWSTAWATPNQTNGRIAAGDTVLFGAGRYRGTQIVPPTGGTFSKRTVYACSTMTTATRGQAVISSGSLVTGWSAYSGSIYRVSVSGCTVPCLVENDYLLQPVDALSAVDRAGRYYYGSGYLYLWPLAGSNPNTMTYEMSCVDGVVTLPGNAHDHVLFFGLDFRVAISSVVAFNPNDNGMADSVIFSNCNLSRATHENGSNAAVVKSQQCYGSGDWGEYNAFVACSLSYCNSTGLSSGPHTGSGFIFYSARNTTIDSCVITHVIAEAVGLKMGNYVNTSGKNARNNCIKNCIIDGSQTFGGVNWGGRSLDRGIWISNKAEYDSVYGNIIMNCSNFGIDFHTSEPNFDDPNLGYTFVGNNTFYNCEQNINISPAMDVGFNQIKYNIGYATSFAKTIGFYVMGGEAPMETPPTEYYWRSNYGGVIDSNNWYTGTAAFVGSFTPNSGFSGTSWTSWRNAGFDVNSININPNFAGASFGDFTRPSSTQEMNRTYGGRIWTRYGAWQPPSGPCTLPGIPTLVSPVNAGTGLTLPLAVDWGDVATATSYLLQIDDNSDFSSPILSQNTGVSSYSATSLTPGVLLYWRVRAQNGCGSGSWSVSRTFTIACSLPGVPTLVSPSSGATGVGQPVSFDWSDISGATLYQIQVDNNSDFSSTNVNQQVVSSVHSAAGLNSGTLYYWRTRAQNICGWGSWSANRTFTTAGGDATPPVLSNIVGKNITDNFALITWTTNESATTQINYGTTTAYGSTTPLNSTMSTSHSQSVSGLSPWTTYHFRVRSRDAGGNEAVSGDYVFTTTEPLLDLDSGIQPTVSSSFPGYSPTRLTDDELNPYGGTASTWAATESSTQPHWVEFNFSTSRVIKRVVIYWAWNATQSRWMTSQQFRLQAWDGAAFTDIVTVNNALSDSCTFLSIAPTTTTRFRYYQPANMGPSTYPGVLWLSELDVFGLTNTAPGLPQLSSPASGMLVSSLSPTITLSNSLDAEGSVVKYHFQVSSNSSFTNIVAQTSAQPQGSLGTTSWVVNPALSAGATYYWRARAHDDFLYSSYTTSRTFVVSPTAVSYVCGDTDGSGMVTISDVVSLISYIFMGGAVPNPLQSADADCTGNVTVSDVVYLISYIFAGGQAPCAGC